MGFKYDLDSEIVVKNDLTVYGTDDETGESYEKVIRSGTSGNIFSQGFSSMNGFKNEYNVTFKVGEDELDILFFESELEAACTITPYIEPNE